MTMTLWLHAAYRVMVCGVLAISGVVVLPAQTAPGVALTGRWVGSGTLTNDWSDAENAQLRLRCDYTGRAQPPSIVLSIPAEGGVGRLLVNMPAPSAGCPVLSKDFQIRAVIAGTRMAFLDPAGDRWDLALTDDLLTGTVAWDPRADVPGESLAVDFRYLPPLRPWDLPRTRLTGKVTLARGQ